MLTLYYSPGACSLASHLTLEEADADYEAMPTLIPQGEHKTADYLRINPRAKVPALKLADGSVLTENVAILTYVARTHPDAGLLPTDPIAEARVLSALAYFSNTVHPAYSHIARPERFSGDEATYPALKAKGRENFQALLTEVDGLLAGKQWLVTDRLTVADLYAMVFYGWGARIELPVKDLRHYTALKDRVVARPKARKVLEREKNILLTL